MTVEDALTAAIDRDNEQADRLNPVARAMFRIRTLETALAAAETAASAAAKRCQQLEQRVSYLQEVCQAAEAYHWAIVLGNVGEHADAAIEGTFDAAIVYYRQHEGITPVTEDDAEPYQ